MLEAALIFVAVAVGVSVLVGTILTVVMFFTMKKELKNGR